MSSRTEPKNELSTLVSSPHLLLTDHRLRSLGAIHSIGKVESNVEGLLEEIEGECQVNVMEKEHSRNEIEMDGPKDGSDAPG